MNKIVSFEERRKLQLEMLQEIHEFCNFNQIRYSLAYGTLIGAIRHKGFIPWDDDVDIMMPLPDMLKLKSELTSDKIKYCDIDTENGYEFGFPRLASKKTYRIIGKGIKSYGVNIDLYPIINVPDLIEERDLFFDKGKTLLNKRMKYIKWRNRIMTYLPIPTIPGFNKAVRDYRNYMIGKENGYGSTRHFFVFGGSLDKKERELCTYNFDLFSGIQLVDFEGLKLFSIEKYHDFLTYYYGDYMTPPPVQERIPYHGGQYYWCYGKKIK